MIENLLRNAISQDLGISLSGVIILFLIYVKIPFLQGKQELSENQSLTNYQNWVRKNRWWLTIVAIILILLGVLGHFQIIT